MVKVLWICLASVCTAGDRAYAQSSMQLASQLGSVIAGEKPCGLDYDQAAIRRYVETKVAADDMQFQNTLNLMVLGTQAEIEDMSASAKTAFCTQTERVARSNGFIH